MTNLSSVSPTLHDAPTSPAASAEQEGAAETVSGGRTTRQEPKDSLVLTFLCSDGRSLSVADGGELGRCGDCCEAFRDTKTISRRHARVSRKGGQWRIEDIGSTNGTWVNGRRLERGRPHPLAPGDSVNLSLSCELKVIA
jgi:pSer/pThr/pTyr-binding forkhead associated (FHA) protein